MNTYQIFNDLAEDYDSWFDENDEIYKTETETLATLVPKIGKGLEIGVGTGRFAMPLGITTGIDPARRALRLAFARGINVCQAVGEQLPFEGDQFDFVLINTVDPFVQDIERILNEINRVLNSRGRIIIGMIDKNSRLGQVYDAEKENDPFFRNARFHSSDEMIFHLRNTGFSNIVCRQTLMDYSSAATYGQDQADDSMEQALAIKDGFGEGAFIALRAEKLTPKTSKQLDEHQTISVETGEVIPS